MSSDNEEEGVICIFCGVSCEGTCDDPDACPSCWAEDYYGEWFGDAELDDCYRGGCNCDCHSDWFNLDVKPKGSFHIGNRTPYVRQGVFPFLKLAAELREKVYHLVLQQTGKKRWSTNFRGRIDTAILSTCRQINKEARHIPLANTELFFTGPSQALHFLGFQLAPTQQHLVKALHFYINGWHDLHGVPLGHLIAELAKIELKHLSVTVRGALAKGEFTDHSCFQYRFLELKDLKSFSLVIGSGIIEAKEKREIIESIQQRMIRKLMPRKTLKRTASKLVEDVHSEEPAKAAKHSSEVSSFTRGALKTKSMLGSGELNNENSAPTQQAETAKDLRKRYDGLAEYAHSFDNAAALVCIRLKQANQAVEGADEETFEKLALSIVQTLEEQTAKVLMARNNLFFPLGVPTQ